MYKNHRITVVIPCLNEKEGIGKVLRELPSFVDEVVVVDNGSTDGTAAVARELGAQVVTELHRGYGRAYKSGFSCATGSMHDRGSISSFCTASRWSMFSSAMHCRRAPLTFLASSSPWRYNVEVAFRIVSSDGVVQAE